MFVHYVYAEEWESKLRIFSHRLAFAFVEIMHVCVR
jgi:hypothetical protein